MGNSARNYWRWTAIFGLAALLRIWGPLGDASVRHPDEFYPVYGPLHFSTGDFNHHAMTAIYPALHYYLLWALYFLYFAILKIGCLSWSLDQWAAYHFFWDGEPLVQIGRWTTVFFALVTVWWAGCVGRRIWGDTVGWLAALFTAVCALHVRQSGLVSVDVPMACWYLGVVWASLRLLEGEDMRWYLGAGALVGLAAASKYPGALSCSAVMAAHFGAGRGLFDRRLWLSGMAAVGTFFAATPYTFLDFAFFAESFSIGVDYLQQGFGLDLGRGWWYYPRVSLPAGLGWVGTALLVCGAIAAGQRASGRVLLAAFLSYYLVMGSGQLVFMRYTMPLQVLGSVFLAVAVARVPVPWRYALLFLALLEPLYGSVRIAQLQAGGDTRSAARAWLEREVPAGSTCCNFGGWAGDVPLPTIEGLWTKIRHYERLWGRKSLYEMQDFLLASGPHGPFYSYVVHSGNLQYQTGSAELEREQACSYVILHRHRLSYSEVNADFAQELVARGELVARFTPGGLTEMARYDPIDAYYLPVGPFGDLDKTGPEIEVWRVDPVTSAKWGTLPAAFAQAYVRGAATFLAEGDIAMALSLVGRGMALDARLGDGYLVSARIMERANRARDAIGFYEQLVALEPERADNWLLLGDAFRQLGEESAARRCYARALALRRVIEGQD